MRIIILLIAAIAIYSTAFINTKCEHVFTQVEQDTVKVEHETWKVSVYTAPPTGKQEGKELICVKCFHKQKQVLDYGQPDNSLRLSDFPRDTVSTFNSGSTLQIKGDTLKFKRITTGTNKMPDSLRNVILNTKAVPPPGAVFAY